MILKAKIYINGELKAFNMPVDHLKGFAQGYATDGFSVDVVMYLNNPHYETKKPLLELLLDAVENAHREVSK